MQKRNNMSRECQIVADVIEKAESMVFKAYNDTWHKIHLGNIICNIHIDILKKRKAKERESR